MSGLLFLTSDDFSVQKGTRGDILCHTIRGFSLILFYSTSCVHCQQIIPIFKKLPGTINGCQFGMINVSANKACLNMSRHTIAPIEYVPYIVLYVNTRPYMVYKGEIELNEIRQFIVEVAKNLENRQKFADTVVKDDGKGIPEYTIGMPLCGKGNVCYLEFDNAYGALAGNAGPGGGPSGGMGRR